TSRRSILEAWVLTGSTAAEIAAKTEILADVIETYETYFFQVRNCLNAESYISHNVLLLHPHPAPTIDNVLKRYAYRGGPVMLERLIELLIMPAPIPKHVDPRAACGEHPDDLFI